MPKVKKVAINESAVSEVVELVEPKQRKSRAKKLPSKEELIKMLLDSSNELSLIIQGLKEDEKAVQGMSLSKVPDLLTETIKNMEEDKMY